MVDLNKTQIRNFTWIIALGMLFMSAGCANFAAYDGPRQPADQVARIIMGIEYYWLNGTLHMDIPEVDGKDLAGTPKRTVEILPGDHTIKVVSYLLSDQSGEAETLFPLLLSESDQVMEEGVLDFTAQAGHDYDILTKMKNGTWHFWMIDIATGQVVSKQQPPLDA